MKANGEGGTPPLAVCPSSVTVETMERKREVKGSAIDRLIEGEDYEWEDGLMVFTRAYHLRRGYCCGSGCRHCPYAETAEK